MIDKGSTSMGLEVNIMNHMENLGDAPLESEIVSQGGTEQSETELPLVSQKIQLLCTKLILTCHAILILIVTQCIFIQWTNHPTQLC